MKNWPFRGNVGGLRIITEGAYDCMNDILSDVNAVVTKPFDTLDSFFSYYQERLPERVGDYRLDEVGPIMSHGTEEEIAGYMENVFSFNGIVSEQRDGLDWYSAPDGDLEWNGGFVRHGYMMYLADEYVRTGDERYAEKIISDMLDYIRRVPPFDPEGKPYLEYKKSTWRPFEAAGRAAENWPVAIREIISSRSMNAEAFAEIFLSFHTHAEFLRAHHWKTGNHACLETAGLAVISLFFPEFRESEEWIRYAVAFLEGMISRQFYPDGYSKEMSGAYHWVAMRNFFALYEVALRNGRKDLFSASYIDLLGRAAYAELYQQKPDYSCPVTNDSNVTTRHSFQLSRLRGLIDPGYIEYRLSDTAKGKKIPIGSFYFPDAKLAVMRSGWDSRAVYADFDMGPWGSNHMNEDQLSLEVSAYGRNLIVNSGRWRYTTSPGVDWLDKAQYFKTTAAYNTVMVDGLIQNQKDAYGYMITGEHSDYARGVFSGGYGIIDHDVPPEMVEKTGLPSVRRSVLEDAVHIREVFFDKDDLFFIVRDTVECGGDHFIEQRWHMLSGTDICRAGAGYSSTYSDANILLLPSAERYEASTLKGSLDPMGGWSAPEYNVMEAAPELIFKAHGRDRIVFDTLLLPYEGNPDSVSAVCFSRRDEENGESRYTLIIGGRKICILTGREGWRRI